MQLNRDVHTSQLESQLQARSFFADKELRNAFQSYTKLLCDYISNADLADDFTHLNPTLIIRKLANKTLLHTRWISPDTLEYWPCS